ncbi:MAG: hypothetical protein V3V91_05685 [Thermoplasmata archaeon]
MRSVRENRICRLLLSIAGFPGTLKYGQLDISSDMEKSPKKGKKIDTVDLSELDVDQCKFIEVGDTLIAVCLEKDKVTIYTVED